MQRTVGEHKESLSPQDKELHFAEINLDYERYKNSKASCGLQYFVHLGVYHQRVEDGLDMRTVMAEELDLTKMGHWSLYWFSYCVLQCVSEAWQKDQLNQTYYKHRERACYIHDFYVDNMMCDKHSTEIFYPEHFPRLKIANTPMNGVNEMMKATTRRARINQSCPATPQTLRRSLLHLRLGYAALHGA